MLNSKHVLGVMHDLIKDSFGVGESFYCIPVCICSSKYALFQSCFSACIRKAVMKKMNCKTNCTCNLYTRKYIKKKKQLIYKKKFTINIYRPMKVVIFVA
jgi:hypothetical protein